MAIQANAVVAFELTPATTNQKRLLAPDPFWLGNPHLQCRADLNREAVGDDEVATRLVDRDRSLALKRAAGPTEHFDYRVLWSRTDNDFLDCCFIGVSDHGQPHLDQGFQRMSNGSSTITVLVDLVAPDLGGTGVHGRIRVVAIVTPWHGQMAIAVTVIGDDAVTVLIDFIVGNLDGTRMYGWIRVIAIIARGRR